MELFTKVKYGYRWFYERGTCRLIRAEPLDTPAEECYAKMMAILKEAGCSVPDKDIRKANLNYILGLTPEESEVKDVE